MKIKTLKGPSKSAAALALKLESTSTSTSTSTMALALAACCVNSFLISAYHFISTFQRKGREVPCPCPGRGLQIPCFSFSFHFSSSFSSKSKSKSLRSKVQRHVAEREAKECQLQLLGSQFMKLPNHTRPRKSRLHKQQHGRVA